MTIEAGSRLGPYEIVAPLGAGGMGEVYQGRDTRLDRSVAIKVLGTTVASDPTYRARLEREAKAISQLSHPNICTLYDVGHEGDVDYLVMEFLAGEPLVERIARGPLPLDQVIAIGIQIAEALEAAHRAGIVHRDLKPGNVMLTKSGAKLLDFGLAKVAEPAAVLSGLSTMMTTDKPLTSEGTLVGTFQYMAPEQLEGVPADARTDIFALGATLYEMATGRRAFEGKTRTSLIAAIVDREPTPISELRPLTPPALEHVVEICLAKDPDRRWQSAHDVAAELRWIAEAGSQAGVATPLAQQRRRRERVWMGVAAIALVAAVAATVPLLRSLRRAPAPTYFSIVAPSGAKIRTTEVDAGGLSVSPDGTAITFTAERDGKRGLWLRRLGEAQAHPIDGAEDGESPFWSPDSRTVAFFARGKLWRADIAGGPPTVITDAPDGRGGSWSPDGTIVFEPFWYEALSKVPAQGGTATALTALSEGETTHRWPWFLPDGRHYIYMAGSHGADAGSELNAIYLASLDSPRRTLLLRARSNAVYVSGHLLFVRDTDLLAQPFDADSGKLAGDPVRLIDGVGYSKGFFRAIFGASTSGLLAWTNAPGDSQDTLELFDLSGKSLGTLGEPGVDENVRFSPDGTRLAVNAGDPADIWIVDLATKVRSRFTSEPLNETAPVWSPDGTRIVFSSDRDGSPRLYVKPVDGLRPAELLYGESGFQHYASDWSRDGRFIAFTRIASRSGLSSSAGKPELWILPLEGAPEGGHKAFPFAGGEFGAHDGVFSPDGRWLAFACDETGRDEIYVAPFPGPGPKRQVSRGGAGGSQWARDGKSLHYTDGNGTVMTVPVAGASFGEPAALFHYPPRTLGDLSPAGDRYVLIEPREPANEASISLLTDWPATLPKR